MKLEEQKVEKFSKISYKLSGDLIRIDKNELVVLL